MKSPANCIICGNLNKGNILWRLYKVYLRRTECSFLWENCCSAKCYESLLNKILSGEIEIVGKDDE